jgi:hypothetical protein
VLRTLTFVSIRLLRLPLLLMYARRTDSVKSVVS